MERGTFQDADFVKAINGSAVPLVHMNSYTDWPTTKVKDGDKEIDRSKEFPRLTVEELQGIIYNIPQTVSALGRWGTPSSLVIDGAEKKYGGLLSKKAMNADDLKKRIAEAQEKLGKPVPEKEWKPFMKAARAVTDPLRKEDLAGAVRGLAGLDKLQGLNDVMKKEVKAIHAKITEAGEHKIEMASYIIESEPEKAKKELDALLKIFKGHALEKKIKELLEKE